MATLTKPQQMRQESCAIDHVVALLNAPAVPSQKQWNYLRNTFPDVLPRASERLLDAAIKLEKQAEDAA